MGRSFPTIFPGMRIVADMQVALIIDFDGYSSDATGRVLHVDLDSAQAWVAFDRGGSSLVPLFALAEPNTTSKLAGRKWLEWATKRGTNLGQSDPPKG